MSLLTNIIADLITQHAFALLATACLLVLSATFSSCETSLFSLSAPELNRVRAGSGSIDRMLVSLHANLKPLLPTLLFCNMGVNVCVFSLAAGIASDLGEQFGGSVAFAYSLASLFLVVFFGEVFPKQLAIASSLPVARLTALPVWSIYRVLKRPMRILNAIVGALERVCDTSRTDSRGLREEELRLLVEMSRNDGAISQGEYKMIDSIVDLPDVRIRDVMIHRIDTTMLSAGSGLADAVALARKRRHCKIPVVDAAQDDLAGWVDVRDIYAEYKGEPEKDDTSVEAFIRDFQYFSEHDRADQVLERIKGSGGDLYAVVDERGIVVGFFTLQDIMDEVLGHFGENGAPPPSVIREMHDGYVISGRLSVREWRNIFNIDSKMPKSATVGGLIIAHLGRIPKVGERVEFANTEMVVLSMWHNQVKEVGVRLMHDDDLEKAKKVSARLSR